MKARATRVKLVQSSSSFAVKQILQLQFSDGTSRQINSLGGFAIADKVDEAAQAAPPRKRYESSMSDKLS
jgi:hypothetical protein